MSAVSVVAVALVALAGCARATLPYSPSPSPRARVSADYQLLGDRLLVEIEIDTSATAPGSRCSTIRGWTAIPHTRALPQAAGPAC